ncbi:MAG TPA: SRPBCC domain-containing protein [Solirubrobacteraceae bacterium]
MEFDHSYSVGNFSSILNLEKLVPCVPGGRVISMVSPDEAKAEIKVNMGAMGMTFTGTVKIIEKTASSAKMQVKAREAGGQGNANATVTFGPGTIHTSAQVTGKAASMGEGTVRGVLDGLITEFAAKLPSM